MGIILQTCLTETAANANSVNWPNGPTNQFSSSIDPKHINPDTQILSRDHRAVLFFWCFFFFKYTHSISTDKRHISENKPADLLDLCMSRCCCSAELPRSFELLGFSPCRVPPCHYHILRLHDITATAVSLFQTWWQHDNLLINVGGTLSTPRALLWFQQCVEAQRLRHINQACSQFSLDTTDGFRISNMRIYSFVL